MAEQKGPAEPKEFLTVDNLSELLQVDNMTIYRLVRRGELPAYQIGRVLRFSRADVEEYLAKARIEVPKTLKRKGKSMLARYQDFQQELDNIFSQEIAAGKSQTEVWSTDLHRKVGGYPGPDHRMPICNKVMRDNMVEGDQLLVEPPKKQGKILIRYLLPRPLKTGV
jgi:5-methylcytosine-specific restriction protein A